MYYNFVNIHQTLRVTDCRGMTSKLWDSSDIVMLLEKSN